MSNKLLLKKEVSFIDNRLHFVEVKDGTTLNIINHKTTFFDIKSTKATQYGFVMKYDNKKLVCCGDEPLNAEVEHYGANADYLMHEAFCLYSEREIFDPYEKHHSTVKDACELAERLNVKNLILYHTEDKNIKNRKALFIEEGSQYYNGNLMIPNDLEIIKL